MNVNDVTNGDLHPWMTSISILNTQGRTIGRCGGAQIDATHIVTAAHCVEHTIIDRQRGLELLRPRPVDQFVVHQRPVNQTDAELARSPMAYVRRIYIHPQREYLAKRYDLAMIELATSMPARSYVHIGQDPGQLTTMPQGVTLGYGRTENTAQPSRLQQTTLPRNAAAACRASIQSPRVRFTDEMACMGYANGQRATCLGDSGGPLLAVDQATLVGVVSFGTGECDSYSIFTNVPLLSPWLLDCMDGRCNMLTERGYPLQPTS